MSLDVYEIDKIYYTNTNIIKEIKYKKNNKLHNMFGPAFILFFKNNKIKTKKYYKEGVLLKIVIYDRRYENYYKVITYKKGIKRKIKEISKTGTKKIILDSKGDFNNRFRPSIITITKKFTTFLYFIDNTFYNEKGPALIKKKNRNNDYEYYFSDENDIIRFNNFIYNKFKKKIKINYLINIVTSYLIHS